MKRVAIIAFLFVLSAWVAGCAYSRSPYLKSTLASETWQKDLDRDPSAWTDGADRWFMTGDPNATEQRNRHAPASKMMSTTQIDVTQFTKVVANGSFQVQIFGTYGKNSVYVYGPDDDVRQTIVKVKNDTLSITQSRKAKHPLNNVIVRVGVGTLSHLEQRGPGRIEVIQLPSSSLQIDSSGHGNVYLTGNVNLRRVNNVGTNTISVFGAKTPTLDITTGNKGSVNVSGIVGIHSITHKGSGDINIIGANSDSLQIYANGAGKIGISGIVDLKEIKAADHTSVLIDCVNGGSAYVYATQRARVGLAGNSKNIYLYATDAASILGRYMYAQDTYAQARKGSHINAAATNKIFASASDNGSIYFFGEPTIMSQFVTGNGVVIPVWTGGARKYPARMSAKYKDQVPPARYGYGTKKQKHSKSKQPQYHWVNGKLVRYKGNKPTTHKIKMG